MKQEKANRCILILFILLICSIILNFVQGDCIESLINQIKILEYNLSITPYQMEEMCEIDSLHHVVE